MFAGFIIVGQGDSHETAKIVDINYVVLGKSNWDITIWNWQ